MGSESGEARIEMERSEAGAVCIQIGGAIDPCENVLARFSVSASLRCRAVLPLFVDGSLIRSCFPCHCAKGSRCTGLISMDLSLARAVNRKVAFGDEVAVVLVGEY